MDVKFLQLIFSLLLLIPITTARAETDLFTLYDATGDGCVNVEDLVELLRSGLYHSDTGATPEEGDFNGDGFFTVRDLVQVLLSEEWTQCRTEDDIPGSEPPAGPTNPPSEDDKPGGENPKPNPPNPPKDDNPPVNPPKDPPAGPPVQPPVQDPPSPPAEPPVDDIVPSGMNLGTNVTQPNYVVGPLMFNDRMRSARPWAAHRNDCTSFTCGPDVPLGANGYPLEVPFGAGYTAKTQLAPGDGSGNFVGKFSLSFKGTGKVRLWGRSLGEQQILTFEQPCNSGTPECSRSFNVLNDGAEISNGVRARLFLEILESSAANPIRDIEVVIPGVTVSQAQKTPFFSGFLQDMRLFSTVRYMDWLATNYSTVREWSERTKQFDPVQSSDKGAAFEWIILLSNQSGTDPWINIPTFASDDYVRKLAELFHDSENGLSPSRKVYIEYSNEVWNGGFPLQSKYAADQARNKYGYTDFLSDRFVARRSLEIFKIFNEVYGKADAHRVVRVLPTQAANPARAVVMLDTFYDQSINPGRSIKADAVAINPYVGGRTFRWAIEDESIYTLSLNELFDAVEVELQTLTVEMLDSYKALSTQYGVTVVGYEGGQHLAAHTAKSRDEANGVVDLVYRANESPRMESIYLKLFGLWNDRGFGVFNHYLHVLGKSKFGDWGSKRYQTQPLDETPKVRAITRAVQSRWNRMLQAEESLVSGTKKDVTKVGKKIKRIYKKTRKKTKTAGKKVRRLVKRLRKVLVQKIQKAKDLSDDGVRDALNEVESLRSSGLEDKFLDSFQQAIVDYYLLRYLEGER